MKKQLPLIAFILLILPFTLTAQTTFKKLVGTDVGSTNRVSGDQFGFSIAISGDVAVVGAPFHDFDENGGDSMTSAGAAYVFYKNEGGTNNWGLKKKLVGSGTNGRDTGDNFGNSVAISGDVIVVGAIMQDFNEDGLTEKLDAGAAYVFYKNEGGADNWGFKKKLVGEGNRGREIEDNFGKEVAISGDIIVVGAYQHDYDAPGTGFVSFSGAAFVYYKDEGGTDNWGQKQKLIGRGPNGRKPGDFFGTSVAIDGDIIAVGANLQDYDGSGGSEQTDAGLVYIFYKDELGADVWGLKQRVAGTGTNGRLEEDNFGIALSLSGNTLVVGAYLQDYDANGAGAVNASGAAFVYNKDEGGADTWGLVKKLVGGGTNGRTVGDNFGTSVSITGDVIVVGASQQDYSAKGDSLVTGAGAIYVFYKDALGTNNWGLAEKIVSTGVNGRNGADNFGNAVATAPDVILAGVFGQDYDAAGANLVSDAGAVLAFDYKRINPNSVTETLNAQSVFVSNQNKQVHIAYKNAGNYNISVYDIMGRIIYQGDTKAEDGTLERINLESVAAGYYMVNISKQSAKQTFKVFLK